MTNGTDDDIYHQFHHKADKEKKQREREGGADTSVKSPSSHDYHKTKTYVPPTWRDFSVAETKTNFSKILREMERGDFDGALITSYGRSVGVLFPDRVLHKGWENNKK